MQQQPLISSSRGAARRFQRISTGIKQQLEELDTEHIYEFANAIWKVGTKET